MELCVCCGGEMNPIYTKQTLEYKELQCGDCNHIMKVGYNKDDGRLTQPTPSHKNNQEI